MFKKYILGLIVIFSMSLVACSGVDDKGGAKQNSNASATNQASSQAGGNQETEDENSGGVTILPEPVAQSVKGYWNGWTDINFRKEDGNEIVFLQLAERNYGDNRNFLNFVAEDGQAAFLIINKDDKYFVDSDAWKSRLVYMILGRVEGYKLKGTAYDMSKYEPGDIKYVSIPGQNELEVEMYQTHSVEIDFKVKEDDNSKANLEIKDLVPGVTLYSKDAKRVNLVARNLKEGDKFKCTGYTDGVTLTGNSGWSTMEFKVDANQNLIHRFSSVGDNGADCNITIQTSVIAEDTDKPSQYNVSANINTCKYGKNITDREIAKNLEADDYKGIATLHKDGLGVYMVSASTNNPVFLRCTN